MKNMSLVLLTICVSATIFQGIPVVVLAGNESDTNTKAEQHFVKANELRKVADHDGAIIEYKKVISLSPDSKIAQNAQYWIGQSYFEVGKLDEALSAFQKLLDEYPASSIAPSTEQMIERVQQAKKNRALFEAAEKGDAQQVKRLVANGVDVNITKKVGTGQQVDVTPLISAASEGHAQVAKVLLENGAEVDATCSVGYTALYYALWSVGINDIEGTIKVLISNGADVNKQPTQDDGYSPLIWAIWMCQEHESIVKDLLDAGARIDFKDKDGRTPLYWAAFESSKEVLDLILERGRYIDTIHLAACKGDLNRVKTLVDSGIDANVKDEFGCTPLHWAVLAPSREAADFLITRGADVNAKDGRNLTPLMAARGASVLELLISKGADINEQDALQGQTKLHMVCSEGDKEAAELLIRNGADIHVRDKRQGVAPLWIASRDGHKEIVELLLKKGAKINQTDRRRDSTPLLIAARGGHTDVVEYLIAKGADIHAADNQGQTPLSMARQQGHTEIVELLRQHGAKETLHGAVALGNIDDLKRLLSEGQDVNSRDSDGQTPLHLAANRGHKEMAEVLIANGADIEARDARWHNTPLLHAAVRGHKEVVELLIEKGANIEARDGNGLTPLSLTAGYGSAIHTDVITLLLEKGANIESRSYGGGTPLASAIAMGRKGVAEMLLKHGARLDVISKFYGTPAHLAMMQKRSDMVRWCVAKGIVIPSLHLAAYFGQMDKVRLLLSEGADVNQKDIAQFAPLHCAVLGHNPEIGKLMIDKGADIEARNCANQTPLFCACARGYLDMIKLLIAHEADLDARGFRRGELGYGFVDDWSPLHIAAHMGHIDVVQYLLAEGADIHVKCKRFDDEGVTPLHLASWNGRVDVVKALLAKGADANLKTQKGHTPLDFARNKNQTDIVELLRKHGAKE